MNTTSPFVIAGPHMGFNAQSRLGGERFEAGWISAMTSDRFQFHWTGDSSLLSDISLPSNHVFESLTATRGMRRILNEARALKRMVAEHRAQLLRFHSVHYGAPTAVVLRALGVRVPFLFQHHHVEAPRLTYCARVRLLAALGAHFAAVSKYSANELLEMGVPQKQISVVLNHLPAWDVARTNSATTPNDLSRADFFDLAFVGGLALRKRPGLVLETAEAMQRFVGARKLRVAIIGQGPLLNDLELRASSSPVEVVLFKDCDDAKKWGILSRSRIFLFPSMQEGFGYAPLEAALAGLWVVSSLQGALPEVLGEFANVRLVDEREMTPSHLAALCQPLLERRPPAVSAATVKRWTDESRFRSEHEAVLARLAEGRIA